MTYLCIMLYIWFKPKISIRMVCLQLGSNKGDRRAALEDAILKLSAIVEIASKSSIYETAAWGKTDQRNFYNQLLLVKTNINPFKLLRKTQELEIKMGRLKKEKWGERLIDIDIIYYYQKVIYSPTLNIPHILFADRKFVMEPLVEISSDWVDPVTKLTAKHLLEKCEDITEVKRKEFNVE